MKHKLTSLAVSGLIALGFAFAAAPANAMTAGTAGGSLTQLVDKTGSNAPVVKIDHRRGHWHNRRHHNPRRHWRRSAPRSGIYFHFGQPAPRYARPYYRPRVALSRAHVNWCHNRYRSYQVYDNSWQPYSGPRRQCISPYYR